MGRTSAEISAQIAHANEQRYQEARAIAQQHPGHDICGCWCFTCDQPTYPCRDDDGAGPCS